MPPQPGGFVASGFKKNELNVAYEPNGLFGGNPLYRQVGGPAAIYKAEGSSQWRAHTEFTETASTMAVFKEYHENNLPGVERNPTGRTLTIRYCQYQATKKAQTRGCSTTPPGR